LDIDTTEGFQHGVVKRIITRQGITLKELARISGWSYQNLGRFLNFKSIPTVENKLDLYNTLKSMNKDLMYDDLYPRNYGVAQQIFAPIVRKKEIDIETIARYNNSIELIDFDTEDRILSSIISKDIRRVLYSGILNNRQETIVKMLFGIEDRERSLKEIADEFGCTVNNIKALLKKAYGKLSNYLIKYRIDYPRLHDFKKELSDREKNLKRFTAHAQDTKEISENYIEVPDQPPRKKVKECKVIDPDALIKRERRTRAQYAMRALRWRL
jgi:DNA-binding CsgD family transcriptional regulator